jgi:hypothetical protein
LIPEFHPSTGALPPGNHQATLEEIRKRFGFTPRRRWLLKGVRAAFEAFWAAGIREIYIDGSFCTEKPDPGDVDGYWVEPDEGVYDRIDPYWIDFDLVLVPHVRKWTLRANIAETLLVHSITEQGGKEIQHEEYEDILSGPVGRAQ